MFIARAHVVMYTTAIFANPSICETELYSAAESFNILNHALKIHGVCVEYPTAAMLVAKCIANWVQSHAE